MTVATTIPCKPKALREDTHPFPALLHTCASLGTFVEGIVLNFGRTLQFSPQFHAFLCYYCMYLFLPVLCGGKL